MTDVDNSNTSPFEKYACRDVKLLIERYPLAWVCNQSGEEASQLPLVGVYDSEDRLTKLIGHFARNNPLGVAFRRNPSARILFNGPSGYVSPADAERSNWAPTWNYAHVRVHAEISVEPDFTAEAVDILIEKMEQNAESPWSVKQLGERYERLLPMITGFRANVIDVKAKFKLGQDERPETFTAIHKNIGNDDLKEWMLRFSNAR